jgi:hypothetical protein
MCDALHTSRRKLTTVVGAAVVLAGKMVEGGGVLPHWLRRASGNSRLARLTARIEFGGPQFLIRSVDDGDRQPAIAILASHGDDIRIVAGGHSLIPMMKLRLAQPSIGSRGGQSVRDID